MSVWKNVKLRDVLLCSPDYGANASAISFNPALPRYIRITDIDDNGYLLDQNAASANIENFDQYILKNGDFLFARTGDTVGKYLLYKKEMGLCIFAGYLIRFKFNTNIIIPDFFNHIAGSYIFQLFKIRMSKTGAKPNLNAQDYCNFKFSLPPLPEQKTIAAILSKVDEAIAAVEDSIKAAEKVKKALMQNLLTGKLKPDGTWRSEDEFYTDEKFGKIPKGWQVARFKNFAVLQRGKDLTDNNVIFGNFPVVKSNGIQIYHNEYFVEPPGVVTGRSGTIGKVFYIENQFWSHNTTLYVKDFKGNYPKYIYYLIQRMKFEQYYAGTTVPTLNRNDIHKIKVSCPNNINEQKEITIKIDEMEKLIQTKYSKIETIKKLKKSLMQNLLTGKIRVNPSQFPKEISHFS